MNLTPDNPRLVEMLIDEMEQDGVFDYEDPEEIEINLTVLERSP